jgi:hypothetical protein
MTNSAWRGRLSHISGNRSPMLREAPELHMDVLRLSVRSLSELPACESGIV